MVLVDIVRVPFFSWAWCTWHTAMCTMAVCHVLVPCAGCKPCSTTTAKRLMAGTRREGLPPQGALRARGILPEVPAFAVAMYACGLSCSVECIRNTERCGQLRLGVGWRLEIWVPFP